MASKADELTAAIEEIRTRVRARYPSGRTSEGVELADLHPLLHARDAAEGKVAAIGTVNPRRGGFANSIVQSFKKMVARALDWHVREQVEFNRAVLQCVQATLDAFGETNRAILLAETTRRADERENEIYVWRRAWEAKVAEQEIMYLRSLAEIQSAFQYRVGVLEANLQELVKTQHQAFAAELGRGTLEIQRKLWEDLARVRNEHEALIHSELRVVRQRASAQPVLSVPAAPALTTAPSDDWSRIDWLRFSDRFRGSDDYIRNQQQIYAQRFAGLDDVLDIGCGRGELIEALRAAGIPARGIELSDELTAICRAKGLQVEQADLFEYLNSAADESIGGVACMQVVEHLPRPRVSEFVQLAFSKMRRGGLLAVETPNPECLAIFATHFYIDPTHRHPVPASLMAFYLEEAGFVNVDVVRLSAAVESMPEVAELPQAFRERFFGGLDYAIFARKP